VGTLVTKRLFDVLLAGAGLVLLVPVLIVVGVLVFVLCRRPVLFRQVRVGRGGRDFVLNKFRTMTLAPGRADGSFEVGSLARVTPLGRFLRKTKLDELPQLWNVIKGDMSLVGGCVSRTLGQGVDGPTGDYGQRLSRVSR
jgi:lipopolysaccharide/colanic/teichoic acid biosynthesis glycosyltransferase